MIVTTLATSDILTSCSFSAHYPSNDMRNRLDRTEAKHLGLGSD
jgi:hypothetical protein